MNNRTAIFLRFHNLASGYIVLRVIAGVIIASALLALYSKIASVILLVAAGITLPVVLLKFSKIPAECFIGNAAFAAAAEVLVRLNEDSEAIECSPQNRTVLWGNRFNGLRSGSNFFVAWDSGFVGEMGSVVKTHSESFLILTPRRFWYCSDTAGSTSTVESGEIESLQIRLESGELWSTISHPEDQILQTKWRHETVSGGPDRRRKDDEQLYLTNYYWATITLPSQLPLTYGLFHEFQKDEFADAILAMIPNVVADEEDASESDKTNPDFEEFAASDSGRQEGSPEWHEVLEVNSRATKSEIEAAYRTKIKQYHPDVVASLGPKFRELAERESKALNVARDAGLSSR